ncbi:MAG: hypothetical protein ABSF23_06380 [Terracidiphilus sp.]|jgi:hypothetical protein
MKQRTMMREMTVFACAAVMALLLAATPTAQAQVQRYVGTVTAIAGDTLTVKTDAGEVHQVQVPSTAQLKRIEPGQTDLSKAEAMDFGGLATGDRVLVTLDPKATGEPPQAARIVAIKQADVAKKQRAETEEWNRGVHGLVKSADPAAGVIVVNTRAGAVTKAVTVNITQSTVLKRYAPGSVRFDQALPGPMDAIRPGDQLWARGARNADGTAIAADGVVSGSFRSIAGTILSIDTAASTVTVKDLATKKPATIHISSDAQLRRLDPNMATFLAARLKGNQAVPGGGPGMPRNFPPAGGAGAAAGAGPPRGFPQAGGGGMPRMDPESMMDRAPEIQLATLQKSEAVMIVATEDVSGVNAIKLLAGVEPLLEAPEARDLLASWSLNQGESAGASE